MPRSGTVGSLFATGAEQYNDLRDDTLHPIYGHTHFGGEDAGKQLSAPSIDDDSLSWPTIFQKELFEADNFPGTAQVTDCYDYPNDLVVLTTAHNAWAGPGTTEAFFTIEFTGPFAEPPLVFARSTSTWTTVAVHRVTTTSVELFWFAGRGLDKRTFLSLSVLIIGKKLRRKYYDPWEPHQPWSGL